ncbi:hypothetical protein ElyMa_003157100 [Elysia marginata]|uniref:Uncharacterized protein n=1 Tax=Elysia marginata TaxID=1093978 RepID=A0AAV4J079_9GAST|nr:hypothetical protein ElyMa_003157100 [Elysia marginata]
MERKAESHDVCHGRCPTDDEDDALFRLLCNFRSLRNWDERWKLGRQGAQQQLGRKPGECCKWVVELSRPGDQARGTECGWGIRGFVVPQTGGKR